MWFSVRLLQGSDFEYPEMEMQSYNRKVDELTATGDGMCVHAMPSVSLIDL